MNDQLPQSNEVWPPPVKRGPVGDRPINFVKWRRYPDSGGVRAIRTVAIGEIIFVSAIALLNELPHAPHAVQSCGDIAIGIAFIASIAYGIVGFVQGIMASESMLGKLATVLPFLLFVANLFFYMCTLNG